MYHCILGDKPKVVIASNTDILTLMLHVFAPRLFHYDPFLLTKKYHFVNVSKIYDHITGKAAAITLLAMFFLTSCDTVSYFYRKSKRAILEWVLKWQVLAIELGLDLGEHTHLKRLAQIFVYGTYVVIYILIFFLWLSEVIWKTVFCSSSKSNYLPIS